MACAQHLLRMPPPGTCDPLWARYSAFQESRQKTRSGARAVAEVLCGEQQHEGRESQARSRARWATYEEGLGGNATEWRAIYNDAWHSRLWLELYPDGPPEQPPPQENSGALGTVHCQQNLMHEHAAAEALRLGQPGMYAEQMLDWGDLRARSCGQRTCMAPALAAAEGPQDEDFELEWDEYQDYPWDDGTPCIN